MLKRSSMLRRDARDSAAKTSAPIPLRRLTFSTIFFSASRWSYDWA